MKILFSIKNNLFIISFFCFSFLLRAIYISRYSWLAGDSYSYLSLAKNVALNQVYGFGDTNSLVPSAFRPPVYSIFISFFWWSGNAEKIVLYLQAFLGALTVLLVYFLARKSFDKKVAVIAAVLFSIEPLTIRYTASIMSETLFTFILMLGIYFLSYKKYPIAGLLFGLAALTRPVILPFVFLLVFLSVFPIYSIYRKAFLTILIFTLIPVSIWTTRNAVVFHELIPISTTGYGYNLLCGTLDVPMLSDEGWQTVYDDPAIIKRRQNIKNGMSESKADRELFREAIRRIVSNPIGWLKVRAKQYTRLYIDSAPYITYILRIKNSRFEEAIQNGDLFLIFYKFLLVSRIFLLVGLAMASMYLLRERFVELSHIFLFPIFLMLIHIPLWTENRYLLPMFPLICIMSSYPIYKICGFLLGRLRK